MSLKTQEIEEALSYLNSFEKSPNKSNAKSVGNFLETIGNNKLIADLLIIIKSYIVKFHETIGINSNGEVKLPKIVAIFKWIKLGRLGVNFLEDFVRTIIDNKKSKIIENQLNTPNSNVKSV